MNDSQFWIWSNKTRLNLYIFLIANATSLSCSVRSIWYGAAARKVASNATSCTSPFAGLACTYRPRFLLVLVVLRLPLCWRVSLSRGVSKVRASKSPPTSSLRPPSHQWLSLDAGWFWCEVGSALLWSISSWVVVISFVSFFLFVLYCQYLQCQTDLYLIAGY